MAEIWDKAAQYWGLKAHTQAEDEGEVADSGADEAVTPLPKYSTPTVVRGDERVIVTMQLDKYGEKMKEVASRFRAGEPIILNLKNAEKAVAIRIIDFASGLIEGLNGDLRMVSDRVMLLTPANTRVQDDVDNRMPNIFDS